MLRDFITRRMMGGGGSSPTPPAPLPYQQVEYLTAAGSQYIEIPFGFQKTDEVHIICACKTGNEQDYFLVAPKTWNNDNNRFAMAGSPRSVGAGYGAAGTGSTAFTPASSMPDANLHEWVYKNYVFSVDFGASKDVSNINFGSETANLRLFFGYNSASKGSIQAFWIIRGGVRIIDLVSVRDGTTGYLYDKVSGNLYGNLGSGDFTYGPDVIYPN